MVPSPNVTANHQEKNARVLSDRGAALLVSEQTCDGRTDALFNTISDLLRHPEKRESMARALREMAIPDASEHIYRTLAGLLKGK